MNQSNISSQVKASLVEKPWFGFDLDDTLHEFRRASSAATTKTLEAISNKHGTPVDELKEAYGHVLRAKTAGAFSDGKTSFAYRRERFSSVLDRFGLPSDDAAFLDVLLDVYERTLNESLQLKDGAEALLKKLKGMGKKVVVITEGPQDAQERTVGELGIGGYVDFLATTNFFGVAKTEGLFGEVLRHLGIGAGEIVFVGDSVVRDMEPTSREGIFSVLFDERGETAWEGGMVKVKSLRDLEGLLGNGDA